MPIVYKTSIFAIVYFANCSKIREIREIIACEKRAPYDKLMYIVLVQTKGIGRQEQKRRELKCAAENSAQRIDTVSIDIILDDHINCH